MLPVTDELTWMSTLADAPEWVPPARATVVVAPHPDDETLGAGGLIAYQTARGIPVTVIAVTDGEAAYRDAPALGEIRRAEQEAALAELGVASRDIVRLGLPDSGVRDHEDALSSGLAPFVSADTLLVAPWPLDPHPDHEACGAAAAAVARHNEIHPIFYLFWTWHRNTPNSLSGLSLVRLLLQSPLQQVRALALSRHRSQLHREQEAPVLPPRLLAPAQRPFETFILHD